MQRDVSGLLDARSTLPLSRLKELGIESPNEIKSVEISDIEGNQIPTQIDEVGVKDVTKNYMDVFAPTEKCLIIPVRLWLEEIPSLGYKTFKLKVLNTKIPIDQLANSARTIYLTLLRAVGYLCRSKLATRKDGVGPEIETPEAQCQREISFRYVVFPHAGRWNKSDIQYQAHEFDTGLFTITADRHNGDLPLHKSFLKVEDDGIILSTVKKAEKENALIIRVWDSNDKVSRGKIECALDISKVHECNLREENKLTFHTGKNKIVFKILPKQIKSFKISFMQKPQRKILQKWRL